MSTESKVVKVTRGQVVKNRPLESSIPQDVGSVPASIIGVPLDEKKDFKEWLDKLYTMAITDEDLQKFYEFVRYKGFIREEVLLQLKKAFPSHSQTLQVIILCALNGPQRASITRLPDGRTLSSMGIPASGGQGKLVLTCSKISAATADLAAFHLKRLNAPKRLDMECPGWLQFPAAAAIKMPDNLRRQHIEFSKVFSSQIGGTFREDIYQSQVNNAYCDERLNLFT